jgi:hypothetical protein
MCLVLQSTAARGAFKYVQGESYRKAEEKYSKLSIAITMQRYEMIPESASRNFGYGIRDPGNRVRFPGCCTLQSIDTFLKRNEREIGVSSILFRTFV